MPTELKDINSTTELYTADEVDQLTQQSNTFSAEATGVNTKVANMTPAITSYTDGSRFFIKFVSANTGASTLRLNALGNKALTKNGGSALVTGDILANQVYAVYFDATNDRFELVGEISSGVVPTVYPEYLFYADQLDNPITSDWVQNSLAPALADGNNNALTIRSFDDTTLEGVGFTLPVPSGATNMIIDTVSRGHTAPGSAKGVVPCIFERAIPNNGAVSSWSAGHILSTISIPTNTNFQYDSETKTLASLGLVAGQVHQFEYTREPANGSDTLVGDWNLLSIKISFS